MRPRHRRLLDVRHSRLLEQGDLLLHYFPSYNLQGMQLQE